MSATYFFDTSALVKRYYEEPGTEMVDSIITGESTVVITSLSVIEAVSAFRRKRNADAIPQTAVNRLVGAFFGRRSPSSLSCRSTRRSSSVRSS